MKRYHIYLKKEIIYEDLDEKEFNDTWNMITRFIAVAKTNIDEKDLSFKKITF